MIFAYRLLWLLLMPIVLLILAFRLFRGKEDPTRWVERFGFGKAPAKTGQRIWFHGASVGELLSLQPLIKQLINGHDQLGVIITSQTRTSASLMAKWIQKEQLQQRVFHSYAPLDAHPCVSKFLHNYQPDLSIFIESEIWPEYITQAAQKSAAGVSLINARLSPKSQPKRKLFKSLYVSLLRKFDFILAQTERDALHLHELGAHQVSVAGNMKFDAPPLSADKDELKKCRQQFKNRVIVIGASTHPDEELQLTQLHQLFQNAVPQLLTILVPRHPQRGAEIERQLRQKLHLQPAEICLRSSGVEPTNKTQIYVADTLGELGLWYQLADISVMGGSLINHGGQNPLEPLKLGTPTLCGPHMQNFPDMLQLLLPDGLLRVATDKEELTGWLLDWLTHPAQRQQQQRRLQRNMPRFSGATARIALEINKKLSGLK